MDLRRIAYALGSTLLAVTGLAVATSPTATATASAPPKVVNGCLESVPEPGSTEPVQICYSLFRPAGASAQAPGPADHAQPRLGRLADHRPGVVREVARRGLRRALLRPARLR